MGVFSWKNFKQGIQNHIRHLKKTAPKQISNVVNTVVDLANVPKQVGRAIDSVVDLAKKQLLERPKQLTSVNNITNPIVRANPLRIGHDRKVDVPVFNTPQNRKQVGLLIQDAMLLVEILLESRIDNLIWFCLINL